ncbi:MAG: TerB family tellurite resistance protein [Rhodospirillales bacterium]|nr:TerB family tellurite resistance protein [Rhodospirillales bacterium]
MDLLAGRGEWTSEKPVNDLPLAVAALLVELARMDDKVNAGERRTIEQLLSRMFKLDPNGAQSLVEQADREMQRSTQYFPFTQQICRHASAEMRVQIIEMLWTVAYSDGALDPDEDALIRQIAGLIQVSDWERGAARKRALENLASSEPGRPVSPWGVVRNQA